MPPPCVILATSHPDDTQKGPRWHPEGPQVGPRRAPGWMHGWIITCSLSKQKNNPPTTHFKSVKRNGTSANHISFSTLRKTVWNFCRATACWVDLNRRRSDEQETPVHSLKTLLVFSRRRTTESFQMHRRCWADTLTGRSGSFSSKYLSLVSYFRMVQALKDNLLQTQAFGWSSYVAVKTKCVFVSPEIVHK